MTRLLLKVAKTVRNKEPVDLAVLLKDVMNRYLPDDVHERLQSRLYISMTKLNGLGNVLVTDFHSKEHLIEVSILTSPVCVVYYGIFVFIFVIHFIIKLSIGH